MREEADHDDCSRGFWSPQWEGINLSQPTEQQPTFRSLPSDSTKSTLRITTAEYRSAGKTEATGSVCSILNPVPRNAISALTRKRSSDENAELVTDHDLDRKNDSGEAPCAFGAFSVRTSPVNVAYGLLPNSVR
ncbi:hypothetical protein NPIL_90471 [Nephila pilipes]|uniref:Uncharacterized protein n=1 Tax=Nephila pilipes TaxID=299642 RepID=A0A8X6QG59_NEPPI|nr:hypothetical protein NPIL_90471 [Nephila pilipes]